MAWADFVTVSPLVMAVLVAAVILLVDLALPGREAPALTVAFAGLAIVALLVLQVGAAPATAFGGGYSVDPLTTFLDIVFVSIVALTILFAPDYLEPRDLPVAEFAAVLIFALSGAMLISAA